MSLASWLGTLSAGYMNSTDSALSLDCLEELKGRCPLSGTKQLYFLFIYDLIPQIERMGVLINIRIASVIVVDVWKISAIISS